MKRISLFYKIYFIVIGVFALLLTAGLIVLGNFLSAYEKSLPESAAETVISEIKDGSFDLDSVVRSKFDTVDDIKELVASAGDNLRALKPATSTAGNEYIIKSGDTRLFKVMLEQNQDKGSFGLKGYKVASVSLLSSGRKITVRAPKQYTVSVNGTVLGEEDISNAEVADEAAQFLPAGIVTIEYVDYTVQAPMSLRAVTASDGEKSEDIAFDAQKNLYMVHPFNDEKLQAKYGDYCLEAVKKYALYLQEKGGFNSVAPYLETDSPFYKKARNVDAGWVRKHSGYDFENESVTQFYAYDNNTFSCRVKLTLVMHATGKEDYRDEIDMTIYLRKSGGKYKIYNSMT